MSIGMLPGQMSPYQLESVLDVARNLHFNFHQHFVSNSGSLENWRVKLISAINKVIVEVEAEIGKNTCLYNTYTLPNL